MNLERHILYVDIRLLIEHYSWRANCNPSEA